ncbi:thioredoxin [Stachybotrys elegans]|uniref:Thioredoxin n=1 Tax=Stachybotrys elegans TaxID=80388 RepID=A0A8K0SK14_9HYPO|nr:thioredoxin [Stachybotrys elegans]
MSLVNIASEAQWQSLLSDTSVVIADFYADWCGPCKMIAPHFERLAKEHSSPKKVAFAKVNVDQQSGISRANGVSAMPTFMIFHKGTCVETIKGANPPALASAISKAVQLADGGKASDLFKTPGRTLGGPGGAGSRASGGGLNFSGLLNALIIIVGLYLASLFSVDPYKAAEASSFNVHRPKDPPKPTGSANANGARPSQRSAFKTLADLGEE